jgi:acyl-homoserine lactone acylase PvdQ
VISCLRTAGVEVAEVHVAVWDDLREADDADAPVTVRARFPYGSASGAPGPGNVVVAPGSFEPVRWGLPAARVTRRMSNALLVGARRSASGHPIFVAGPQVGYFSPEILMEQDLHGGGLTGRGVTFPGLGFYLQIGRGADFAWSATSADSDVIDQFVEVLCGDEVHYFYNRECRPMETFDAGVLKGRPGEPDQRIVYRTTVHGPVIGYARNTEGARVAIALARSTRGRELLSAIPFQKLTDGTVRSPQSFIAAMSGFELTFNWFYADSKHIAVYSSGRLPLRPAGVNTGLPTIGTGGYEWTGFLPPQRHVQAIDPAEGLIVNWNNKPGSAFNASDSNWAYGSVHRVQLLQSGLAARRMHTPTTVVAAMNRAATQDLRAVEVLPQIVAVLRLGKAPSARDERMVQLLADWNAKGSARLDRDVDGFVDAPGAAILDAAWPKLADAVLSPVLGPLTERLASMITRDDAPSPSGSAYGEGWYGYVQKDLRAVLGQPSQSPFRVRYCGRGDTAACAASLWAALDAAGDELERAQGGNPDAWRVSAVPERIRFAGFLSQTMRWANRPTFQQVVVFGSHR